MYESRTEAVIPADQFRSRLLLHFFGALLLLLGSVLLGVAGHLYFEEGVTWYDAVFNASLLLGGIGPLSLPETVGGKLFFSFYGLYVGLVFVASIGLILAPVAHRVMHRFHCEG